MNKSTKKTLTGIAIAAVGSIVVNIAWQWFRGDQKVEEAKAKFEGKAA